MPFETPEDIHLWNWILIGCLSAWSGIVRYVMDIQISSGKWSWANVVFQIIISSFTGLMGGLLGFEMGASQYLSFITAGLLGAMGSSALIHLNKRILNIEKDG